MKQRRCFLQNRIIWDNFSKDTDLYVLERAGAQDVWGCSGVIGGLCLFSIAMEGNKKDQEHAGCLCFLNCSLNISSSNTVKRPCN